MTTASPTDRRPRGAGLAPGPSGHFLLGNLADLRHRAIERMNAWHETYGDIVRFRLGPRIVHMLNHPALAQQVLMDEPETYVKMYRQGKPHGLSLVLGKGLVTSTGDLWKRQRRLIQPMFHRSSVAGMESEIIAAGRRMLDRWERLPRGTALEVGDEMMQLTLEVITRTMFSTSVLDAVDVLGPALRTALQYAANSMQNPFLPPPWLPTPGNLRFRRAMRVLNELIGGLIGARRKGGTRHGDLLDLLLEARDESGNAMDDDLIRDEALTIFAAGHETTAVALTWTWYLLARHPQMRANFTEELGMVLGGRAPAMSDLPRLRHTRAIFDEALRLYPPAVAIMRAVKRDAVLGGYAVPRGSLILVNIRNIHRHPGLWEAPDEFRPERFLDAAPRPAHRLAFMPFGAGPRVCVGNHFATMEATLLLALIGQSYQLEMVSKQPVEPVLAVTQKPANGLRMRPRRLTAA